MEKKLRNEAVTQGVETSVPTVQENGIERRKQLDEMNLTGKKKQKASASYTIRAFGEHIVKLKELDLITDEDVKKLKEIHGKAGLKYVGLEL